MADLFHGAAPPPKGLSGYTFDLGEVKSISEAYEKMLGALAIHAHRAVRKAKQLIYRRTPVDTGLLRSNPTYHFTKTPPDGGWMRLIYDNPTPYATYQHNAPYWRAFAFEGMIDWLKMIFPGVRIVRQGGQIFGSYKSGFYQGRKTATQRSRMRRS